MKCSSVCCMAAIESYVTLVLFFFGGVVAVLCLVFSMSGSFKQQCRDEETSGIERVRSCRR